MAIRHRGHCRLTSPPGDLRFFSTSSKSNPTNSISLHFWEDSAGSRGLGVAGVVARDIDSDGTFCCHHHPNWQAQDAPSRAATKSEKKKIIQCLPLLLRSPGQAAQIPVDDRACGPKLISISDYRRRDQTNISPLIPMHDATCGVDCAQIPF